MEIYILILSYLLIGILEVQKSKFNLPIIDKIISADIIVSFLYVLISISYAFMHFTGHNKMKTIYGIPIVGYYIISIILLILCYIAYISHHKKNIQKKIN